MGRCFGCVQENCLYQGDCTCSYYKENLKVGDAFSDARAESYADKYEKNRNLGVFTTEQLKAELTRREIETTKKQIDVLQAKLAELQGLKTGSDRA